MKNKAIELITLSTIKIPSIDLKEIALFIKTIVSDQETHLFFHIIRFNRLIMYIRDTLKYLEKYFRADKVD